MKRYSNKNCMVLAKKKKNRDVDQWNQIEVPDINPQTYEQLIFDKGAKPVQWKKEHIF